MNRMALALVAASLSSALGVPAAAAAQSVSGGIRADLALASFQNADYSTNRRVGLRAGVFADVGLRGPFGLRAEAAYTMKGVKNADSTSDVTVKLDYIEVPIMAKLSLGGSPGFVLLTGPAAGIKVSSKLTSDSGSTDYGDLVHPIDFGWVAGLGFDASLGGNAVSFDVRYTLGLRSVFDFGDPEDTDSDDKNQVISAGVAIVLF